MHRNILFLTLRTFSATGGIEKVSKIICKALTDIYPGNSSTLQSFATKSKLNPGNSVSDLMVYSMYDATTDVDEKYISIPDFRGFKQHKFAFSKAAIQYGIHSRIVILSHINLLSLGCVIKLISPHTKLVLFAHGIEVWEPLSFIRKWMIKKCDKVICVSQFTKNAIVTTNRLPDKNLLVLNNCLDPYLPAPVTEGKSKELQHKYGLNNNDKVLITLTRLSSKELYKGYDQVLHCIKNLSILYPTIKYMIVGRYDKEEKRRLEAIIKKEQINDHVIFTGYIQDEEIAAYYNLADIYVMPSKKEGFGIVFIEAMYYGLPVIAGNKDGSADALLNGKLGLLVNPDNKEEIHNSIQTIINNKASYLPDRALLMEHFSFDVYKQKFTKILQEL